MLELAAQVGVEDVRLIGGRGRPVFLVTTELFLRRFGLGSLSDLPPRQAAATNDSASISRLSSALADGDNQCAEWTDAHGR